MAEFSNHSQVLIKRLTEIVLANLGNDKFGVSEFAKESGMSRSRLNRKVLFATGKTSHQFIHEIRLHKAMEILQNEDVTASEVAYKTGFSSPAYFNKCFHEYFGYPPGKVKKADLESTEESKPGPVISDISLKKPVKHKLHLLLAGILFMLGLIITAIFLVYPKIFRKDIMKNLRASGERISVVVMPFQNFTNDTTWNIYQVGIQYNLINYLSNYPEELQVRQTESVTAILQSNGISNYAKITPSIARAISQKMDADLFIYGSINQGGSTLRLNAQLVDSKTEEALKSFQINGPRGNILLIIDSLSIQVKNFLIISKLTKEGNPAVVKFEATTKYPEAFKCVVRGTYAFFTKRDYPTAINEYLQSMVIDSNYLYPAIMISYAYLNQGLYADGKKWCQKIYERKDQLPILIKTYASAIHAWYFETPYEVIKYLKQILEIDDQLPDIYPDIGMNYRALKQYSRAIPEYKKALEIYEKWGIKPITVINYVAFAMAYHETGQYKKGKILLKKAEKDFPNDYWLFYGQAIISLDLGDTAAANRYIKKYVSVFKDNSMSEANIISRLANLYYKAGIYNKAEEYYRQALSIEPLDPSRMNNLALLLIDKSKKIDEGLELIEKALKINADSYYLLDTKGWGLYKHGKYQEALDILQKSWDLRRQYAIYNHEAFLRLEAAKKAVANQKNN